MVKELHINSFKSYIICIIIFLFVSCNSLTSSANDANMDKTMIKCLVKQVGIESDAYYITISKACGYNIKRGTLLENQNLLSDNITFRETISDESIHLNDLECEKLKELISQDKQEKLNTISTLQKGGWEIYIILEGRKHQFYLKDNNDPASVNKIFYKIKNLSPIQINLQWR